MQILIFLNAIQNPVNKVQSDLFLLQNSERDEIRRIEQRVLTLLPSKAATSVIEHVLYKVEDTWTSLKKNKRFNYKREPSAIIQQKLADAVRRKRDQKAQDKKRIQLNLEPKVSQVLGHNQHKSSGNMHSLLRAQLEKFEELPKKVSQRTMSSFLHPVLCDLDPAQGIEEEYKNKHNQVFVWRMLR